MKYIKYIFGTLLGAVLTFAFVVHANPSYLNRTQSAAATTTLAYLDPFASSGTVATSTLTINNSGTVFPSLDSATIAVQFTASSSASTLEIQPQFSSDGTDWYGVASSTVSLTSPAPMSDGRIDLQFASSTNFQSNGDAATRVLKIYTIPTYTKYSRVLFYLRSSSLRGAVWAEVISKQQTN